jgi:hypothetical protein
MSLAHYELAVSTDCLSFEFDSDGPKGTIKKVIHYTKLDAQGFIVYNLGFGDFNEATGKINDLSVTNNQDRDWVLGTVANSVLYFFNKYPDSQVVFKGSTPARTRLYIMEISKHWNEVKDLVSVEGLTGHGWESFYKNRRYTALLITPKKS